MKQRKGLFGRPTSDPFWWFCALLVALVLALTFLAVPRGSRAAPAAALCLSAAVVTAVGHYRLGSFLVVTCLSVHDWLNQAIGLRAFDVSGLNVGMLLSGFCVVVFLLRYGLPTFHARTRGIFGLYIVLLALTTLVTYRGTNVLHSEWLALISGPLRLGCVWLWMHECGWRLPPSKALTSSLALIVGPVVIALSTVQAVTSATSLRLADYGAARASGLYDANYAMAAVAMGSAALLAISDCASLNRATRVFAMLASAFGVLCIPFLGSRTGALALLAGLLAVFATGKAASRIVLLLMCAATLLSLPYWPASIVGRFTNLQDQFVASRQAVQQNAWDAFLAKPLLGGGLNSYYGPGKRSASVAHNTLLAALAEGGIVYAVFFLSILWALGRFAWHSHTIMHDPSGRVLLGALAAYCVASGSLNFTISDYNSYLLCGYTALTAGIIEQRCAVRGGSQRKFKSSQRAQVFTSSVVGTRSF